MAENNQVYKMGRRFIAFRNIFDIAATLIVICFYFIYDYVYAESLGFMRGLPLLAIFGLVDLVIMYIAKWWCDRVMSGTSYTLSERGLELQTGTIHRTYLWKDFEYAYYDQVTFATKCPVTYRVSGKKFLPNQYLDGLWEMNGEIVERIRPYADIEEGLEKKISAFSG